MRELTSLTPACSRSPNSCACRTSSPRSPTSPSPRASASAVLPGRAGSVLGSRGARSRSRPGACTSPGWSGTTSSTCAEDAAGPAVPADPVGPRHGPDRGRPRRRYCSRGAGIRRRSRGCRAARSGTTSRSSYAVGDRRRGAALRRRAEAHAGRPGGDGALPVPERPARPLARPGRRSSTSGLRFHLAGVVGVYIVGRDVVRPHRGGAEQPPATARRGGVIALSLVLGARAAGEAPAGLGHGRCSRTCSSRSGSWSAVPVARALASPGPAGGAGGGQALRARAGRPRRGARHRVRRPAGAAHPFAVAPRARARKMGLLDLNAIAHSTDGARHVTRPSHVPVAGGAAVAGLLTPDVSAQDQPADPVAGRQGVHRRPRGEAAAARTSPPASRGGTPTSPARTRTSRRRRRPRTRSTRPSPTRSRSPSSRRSRRPRDKGEIDDPLLARQIDVLYLRTWKSRSTPTAQEDHAKANAVEQTFNVFRAKVDGKEMTDSEVRKVLKESTDSALRQKVWEASKDVGGGRRGRPEGTGQAPQRGGDASSASRTSTRMMLTLNEQDGDELIKLFDDLDDLTREPFTDGQGRDRRPAREASAASRSRN